MLRETLKAEPTTKTGGTVVNIQEWLSRATMDIIGIFGFGYDFQCGESSEAKLIEEIWTKLVITGMELPGFVAPLVLRIFPWLLKLPVKAIETQGAIRQIIRGVALQIVQRRETEQGQEDSGKDLLSVLLKMKDSEIDLDNLLDQVRSWFVMNCASTLMDIPLTRRLLSCEWTAARRANIAS